MDSRAGTPRRGLAGARPSGGYERISTRGRSPLRPVTNTRGGGGPPFPTQPHGVSLVSEKRRGPKCRRTGRHAKATVVPTTIASATGCCQSIPMIVGLDPQKSIGGPPELESPSDDGVSNSSNHFQERIIQPTRKNHEPATVKKSHSPGLVNNLGTSAD